MRHAQPRCTHVSSSSRLQWLRSNVVRCGQCARLQGLLHNINCQPIPKTLGQAICLYSNTSVGTQLSSSNHILPKVKVLQRPWSFSQDCNHQCVEPTPLQAKVHQLWPPALYRCWCIASTSSKLPLRCSSSHGQGASVSNAMAAVFSAVYSRPNAAVQANCPKTAVTWHLRLEKRNSSQDWSS